MCISNTKEQKNKLEELEEQENSYLESDRGNSLDDIENAPEDVDELISEPEALELDFDDGLWKYEVEIRDGLKEYDADINAETGKIIKWEVDRD